MRGRPCCCWAAIAPLLLLLALSAGCVEDYRTRLVSGEVMTEVPPADEYRSVNKAPATEAVALRVVQAGQKILDANPQIGLRPMFITLGAPHPEVFHQGGQLRPYQLYVSQGLVNGCRDESELAAVLCVQLGRMVSEREALADPATADAGKRMPPAEAVGHDSAGAFGGPDGTRIMEAAKYAEKAPRRGPRSKTTPPPAPEALARKYLAKAGYPESAVEAVTPLLRAAEDHDRLERQMRRQAQGQPPAVPR